MDAKMQAAVKKLRKMTSSDGASWLITHHPEADAAHPEALRLITQVRWNREDQMRLARHYLPKISVFRTKAFEIFATIMAFDLFLQAV